MESRENTYRYCKQRKVSVIGVAVKEGQDEEGPELGPKVLRDGNILKVIQNQGWEYGDLGDITAENTDELKKKYAQTEQSIQASTTETKRESSVKKIEVKGGKVLGKTCEALFLMAQSQAKEGNFVLTLGGDHGIAIGSILGLLAAYPNLRLIWVDAHGDINTPESSPSGNYHGMPAAHATGLFGNVEGFEWVDRHLLTNRLVLIGLRDIDEKEKLIIRDNKIKFFSMHEIDRWGIGEVMEKCLKYLDPNGENHPIHLSWDIDSVDPIFATSTGTRSRGGLTYREAHYITRRLAETGNLVAMDLVEINPLLGDRTRRQILHGDDQTIQGTETVCLGIELVKSTLGHTLV